MNEINDNEELKPQKISEEKVDVDATEAPSAELIDQTSEESIEPSEESEDQADESEETEDSLEEDAALRVKEITEIVLSDKSPDEIIDLLNDYHENDIAQAVEELEEADRKKLYRILGAERLSEIFPYFDDVSELLEEITPEQAADVLENMDADDAVDVLEEIEDEEVREQIIALMDDEASEDVRLISSYEDDQIGSMMTTNYVTIMENYTIGLSMKAVIEQAEENDNINTIYVVDEAGKYCGAIELRDLIIARKKDPLENIISRNYPSVNDKELISDVIAQLRDYSEDSIPVLNENDEIIGVITAEDIIEAVDDEMGEDYAKLAGLTAEEDLEEKLFDSLRKRLPWLILLLGLSMIVSTVAGFFEGVIAQVAVVVGFQSLILGMAGNVGTQSLAVTIRVLMDENISSKDKLFFAFKEMRIGAANGFLLGTLAFSFVGVYMHFAKAATWAFAFSVSGCVGGALFLAMIISSFMGSMVPMIFHRLKVDPAVASGPLITTLNDLTAVITYYGLVSIFLVGLG